VTGWDAFEPSLSKAESADPIDLWRCADAIPPEWYGHDFDALQQLAETLYERRLKIRDLITAFKDSSRQPFPNWNGGPLKSLSQLKPTEILRCKKPPNSDRTQGNL
jgi:hypothetical protein